MCIKCLKKAKRLGHSKPTGREKVNAHRLINGEGIPIFADMATNVAIEAHAYRIEQAKKRRKYSRKNAKIDD